VFCFFAPIAPLICWGRPSLWRVHLLGRNAPFMGAPVVPVARHDKRYEPFILQLFKCALGGPFADAQRANRFIHRQAHIAVVAAVVAGV
jgi:hypothetical protein